MHEVHVVVDVNDDLRNRTWNLTIIPNLLIWSSHPRRRIRTRTNNVRFYQQPNSSSNSRMDAPNNAHITGDRRHIHTSQFRHAVEWIVYVRIAHTCATNYRPQQHDAAENLIGTFHQLTRMYQRTNGQRLPPIISRRMQCIFYRTQNVRLFVLKNYYLKTRDGSRFPKTLITRHTCVDQ